MTNSEFALEKTSNATSRSGHTVERAAKLSAAKVDNEVIALQLSLNSINGNQYSADEIPTLVKVYEDAKSRPGITTEQYDALINDQMTFNQQQAVSSYQRAMEAIFQNAGDVL